MLDVFCLGTDTSSEVIGDAVAEDSSVVSLLVVDVIDFGGEGAGPMNDCSAEALE